MWNWLKYSNHQIISFEYIREVMRIVVIQGVSLFIKIIMILVSSLFIKLQTHDSKAKAPKLVLNLNNYVY